jgi:hypothetical protein
MNATEVNMEENRVVIEFEDSVGPEEVAARRNRMEQFRRNSDWLEQHFSEVYGSHRGKSICIAGQELFVGDTAIEAVAKARAAHPEEKGLLIRYIYKEKAARIYAL